MAHPEIPDQAQLDPEQAVCRFENGEPLPYILGHWEFLGIEFGITPEVLIPRPETELLVEKAIAWLQESPVRRTVADVGTGSGIIAVSVAVHIPDAQVLATDISYQALRVARANARKFDVSSRIDFIQCDILPQHPDPLPTQGHFDLICANLPYIPTESLHRLPIYQREPTIALDGGEDGLDLLED
jgi:release factor glutamine methyltransferase